MQSQNNNYQPGGGPWAKQTSRMPDLEDIVRRLQSRLQQFLYGGGLREKIIIFCLILAGFVAWTSFYTVPSDSVAVLQRFGKYLDEVFYPGALELGLVGLSHIQAQSTLGAKSFEEFGKDIQQYLEVKASILKRSSFKYIPVRSQEENRPRQVVLKEALVSLIGK